MRALRRILRNIIVGLMLPGFGLLGMQAQAQSGAMAYYSAFKSSGFSLVRVSDDLVNLYTGPALLRLNSDGTPLDVKRYLTSGVGQGRVIRAANGNMLLLLAHASVGPGNGDALLFRIDSAGTIVWIRAYGTASYELPAGIAELPDGTILMLLSAENFAGPLKSLVVSALNQWGDQLWHYAYISDEGPVTATSLLAMPGGDLFLCGNTADNSVLIKTDAAGNLKWSRSYAGIYLNDLATDPVSGDLYLCGYRIDTLAPDLDQAVVICQDSAAQIRWQRSVLNSPEIQGSTALCLAWNEPQQQILCGGKVSLTSPSAADDQALALVFDRDGLLLSAHHAGGPAEEAFQDVLVMDASTSFWSGYTSSFGPDTNIFLMKGPSLESAGCLSLPVLLALDTSRVWPQDPGYHRDTGNLDVATFCFPPQTESPQGRDLCSPDGRPETSPAPTLRVYPNPSRGRFYIDYPASLPDRWEVRDLTGRRITDVRASFVNGQVWLDFDETVPAGYYKLLIVNKQQCFSWPLVRIR